MDLASIQRRLAKTPYLFAFVLMLVTIYINYTLQDNLFEERPLRSNFQLFLPLAIAAVGQTIVIIAGGIDLSVGAIYSLANVIIITRVTPESSDGEVVNAIAVALAAGMMAGAFNGIAVAYLRLQPIVTTYATSFIFGGLALYILPRPDTTVPREWSRYYTREMIGDIPGIGALPFTFWMLMLLLVAWLLLRSTRYAQYIYASGGQPDAAYSSGVPVTTVKFSTYIISGLLAALAATAFSMQTGSANPAINNSLTLNSIVVVVIGGTRLSGGQGGAVGTILGVVIYSLIGNIISFADWIPSDYDTLVNALIIIAALAGPGLFQFIRNLTLSVPALVRQTPARATESMGDSS